MKTWEIWISNLFGPHSSRPGDSGTFSLLPTMLRLPLIGTALALTILTYTPRAFAGVSVSERDIVLPTYLAGEPEPNPMFYFGRQSQGAQGRVYPYSLYDSLTHIKSNKTYRIIYLENEFIRIGVLPEIGGRLFEAVDKSNNYDFVYRQHVIKPALIGLIGAWMSGGIEWNIPHHHRATTFLPVQYRLEKNADGSTTVWVGELEVRQRMRWAVGYTLSPGKSYLTAKVRIINRTPFPWTMLCFANVAVHANDQYQIIFPPDTQFVTYHHKNDFASWPIATGRYSGADFGSGTDVSWYANHTDANSMFAWNYTADFFAGYDHGKEAGTMSVADHHIVPGKKFWTWGSGPRGRMWDKILTDNDGPYIELMTGAYSDNQPDYSWLQPFETKSFEMHWYPFRGIGGVKNANLDAAVNLEVGTNGMAKVGFCTTAAHRSARALLKAGEKVLLDAAIAINPGLPFVKEVPLPSGVDAHDLRASLLVAGQELVAYAPVRLQPEPRPDPVRSPPAPKDLQTVEELYLTGQRIEQFHDAGREPEPYWEEALSRDPGDARVNTALGIRRLKQARFAEAEQHFRTALARLTASYTTPRDGEAFYYLGVALKAQNKLEEAFDAFYKATWSEAWRDPAYVALAEIATRRGDLRAALEYVERSLNADALNIRALTLKAALLRHTGRPKDALATLVLAGQVDPLDVRVMSERWLADRKAGKDLVETLRQFPQTGLETAAEYGNAGLWQDGADLLDLMTSSSGPQGGAQPIVCYYLGQFAERLGDSKKAAEYRHRAMQSSPAYGFPFQWEAIHVLRRAMELNPQDARAPYYLGNLLFDWQPAEATRLWEQSAALDPSFAIVHRNLAAAYMHQKPTNDTARAIAQLEQAVESPVKYALHFAELDTLYAETRKSPAQRLALLEQNHAAVSKRDDALSREIGLKVFAGKYDEAVQLMTGRTFSVWEGGTLEVADHWVNAHLLRGQQRLAGKQFAAALADFQAAGQIPENLPSDRGSGRGREAEIAYWTGLAHQAAGDTEQAKQSWRAAVAASTEVRGRRRAEGPGRISERSVQIYHQALARKKLGEEETARQMFNELEQTASQALQSATDPAEISDAPTPRTRASERTALAHCVKGLGYLGRGEKDLARTEFEAALHGAPDLLLASTELARLGPGGNVTL
jgi:tetratricopeptide (TPR) repeat protein